jgi:hypothetical protein
VTVSIAAPARASVSPSTALRNVYVGALAFWLVTRWLVLVHQGAWPWMNAFVVAAARGIVVGDWNEAVRPQLPAVLGVPLALAGATEQQMVAALYLIASLAQFGAFLVLLRTVFPARLEEQTIGLLVFLVVPFNHSIHHYRDMPVVLASAAVFLLSADFITRIAPPTRSFRLTCSPRLDLDSTVPSLHDSLPPARLPVSAKRNLEASRGPSREEQKASRERHRDVTKWPLGENWRHFVAIAAVMLLGVWSRIEILTFVGVLILLMLVVSRRRALGLAISYGAAAVIVTGALLVVYRLEDVDLSQAWFYTAHTFLDSTPDSWLSPQCQAEPTENCREADGLAYFGPADLHAGVLALAMNHPLTTLAKTARSALDNLWVLLGSNLSTFPGTVPFVVLALGLLPSARGLYRQIPSAVWIVVAAIVAESVLPPLSWAPPHPQYHVALVVPIVILLVPVLLALVRMPRGRWVALGFLVANAGLSAFRYTRYPGY